MRNIKPPTMGDMKVIKIIHEELNALVETAIEKDEKINEAEVMRISKKLDFLINQYIELTSDTDNPCV